MVIVVLSATLLQTGCGQKTGGGADFTLSAGDLLKEYLADRAAADKKYKGKMLAVSGTVDIVLTASGKAGGPHFSFHNPSPNPDAVECVFAKADDLKPFKTRQPARVIGRCDGVVQGNSGAVLVVLRDCKAAP